MKVVWKKREPIINYNENDTVIDKILKIRGIEKNYNFLFPNEEDLHDPFRMGNMRQATNRLVQAVKNNERIGIYTDIDCDGVTATAAMYRYLTNFTSKVEILFNQRNENHGVKPSKIPNGIQLLIIVDSSTNSVQECQEINKEGIDIIILDHHIKEKENPYALIVNPQICSYPNKHLSGVGVVFQVCRALDCEMGTDFAFNYIDLVAVGNLGDLMNVKELETRFIIYTGLLYIHSKEGNLGLLKALKVLKKDYKPTALDLSFYLIPLINSTIRMNKIEKILELLICDDEERCLELAKECNTSNSKRKTTQKDILDKLKIDPSHKMIIVDTTNQNINSGLNGLLATSICKTHQKPCLVVSEKDGLLVGSGRSYNDLLNLKDVLQQSGLFNSAEGHSSAFGVEFPKINKDKIIEHMNEHLSTQTSDYVVEYDLELDSSEITWDLLYDLEKLCFVVGEGFPEPVFLVTEIIPDSIKEMGSENDHLKVNSDDLELVKFFINPQIFDELRCCDYIDILGSLSINRWYNFAIKEPIQTKQIKLVDLKTYNL